ncbi:KH domain-containing protein, partial [Candidatus Saccharibacteria bacterium]|nr:KH domain-containing protein [Candidatus Saccharibacteria bacterium]
MNQLPPVTYAIIPQFNANSTHVSHKVCYNIKILINNSEKLMATIDQQFVEYIVKTLVNNPDKVQIDRQIDEKGVLLSLTVDPEDVGRVIGRRGA